MKLKDGLHIVEDDVDAFRYHLAEPNQPFAICGARFEYHDDLPERWGDMDQFPQCLRTSVRWCLECKKLGAEK